MRRIYKMGGWFVGVVYAIIWVYILLGDIVLI